jgi:hypothetical protein
MKSEDIVNICKTSIVISAKESMGSTKTKDEQKD